MTAHEKKYHMFGCVSVRSSPNASWTKLYCCLEDNFLLLCKSEDSSNVVDLPTI